MDKVEITVAGSNTLLIGINDIVVDLPPPGVSAAQIAITSSGSGTGGVSKIGDVVTATWNNTAGADNNADSISGVTVDFSAFGRGSAVAASNSGGTSTATHTLVAGAIDATARNVTVTATDNAGNATTTADTSNAAVDIIGGTVTGVTSTTANGTYRTWDSVSVVVSFSDAVTVTGTPQLTLAVAGGRAVDYTSGSGSSLTFVYTVQSGDSPADLDYSGTTALAGTITDDVGNAMTLTLAAPGAANSLGANRNIVIDAVAPTVSSVSVPANGAYLAGQNLEITVNLSEVVVVNTGGGTPYLPLTIGSTARQANYVSGSGTANLTFRHTVQAGDADGDGIAVGGAITLNGGTVTDSAGNALTVTLNSVGSTTGVTVDGRTAQTISFANPGARDFGTTPSLTATASSGLAVSFSSATPGVCTVTGGGALTFVSAGSCSIDADQAGDATHLPAVTVSQTFTVNTVVPGAPTIGAATAGDTQATVAFTAPASTGGGVIAGYTVTANPGGATGTGAASPITVAGLTNGVAYTFTVTATNGAGTGAASAPSNSVTPQTGQVITFANPGAQDFGTAPTVTATASSGLTVAFTSSTTGVCTVTGGGVLTFVTAGTCTINADLAGDGQHAPAPQVSQSFAVRAVLAGRWSRITNTRWTAGRPGSRPARRSAR